jgi:hypothetical protein
MIAAIGFVPVLTGSIAAYLTGTGEAKERSDLAEIIDRFDRIEGRLNDAIEEPRSSEPGVDADLRAWKAGPPRLTSSSTSETLACPE